MLEKLHREIKKSGEDDLKIFMQKSILHIVKILEPPSVTSIATDTRLILSDTHTELQIWIETNRERFVSQKRLFDQFLTRFQSLHSKIEKLTG
ncbi:MAG: hypothetical protein JW776_11415 [Candidatus Lokiarchaeota archaeon]|nr:hypothetical protein [Candidatus Lokiarchaeota archaeon]